MARFTCFALAFRPAMLRTPDGEARERSVVDQLIREGWESLKGPALAEYAALAASNREATAASLAAHAAETRVWEAAAASRAGPARKVRRRAHNQLQ